MQFEWRYSYVVLVVALLWLAQPAISLAATETWDGGSAASSNWNTGDNWADDSAPVANDALIFAGTTRTTPTNNLAADTNFGNITFDNTAGAFTLSGNRFRLGGDITNLDTQLQTINNNLLLSGTRTINTASGNMTLGGVLSDTGGIFKMGSNTLTLTGASTYTGGSTISAGTISISAENNLGAPSGAILLDFTGDGTLHVTGSFVTTKEFTAIGNSRSMTFDIDSGITLTANGNVRSYNGSSITTKTGAGTLILGVANDQFDADIALTEGTLDIRHNGALGNVNGDWVYASASTDIRLTSDSQLDINGNNTSGFEIDGTNVDIIIDRETSGAGVTHKINRLIIDGAYEINISSGSNIASGIAGFTVDNLTTVNGNGVIDVVDSDTLMTLNTVDDDGTNSNLRFQGSGDAIINGAITIGSGSIERTSGTGVLTLAGTNTYTGTTLANAGTIRVNGGSAIIDTGTVQIGGGGTFDLDDSNETIGQLNGSGAVTLGSGTLTIAGNSNSSFSGVISGAGGLAKDGTGILELTGDSTFSGINGLVDVNYGELQIESGGSTNSLYFYIGANSGEDATVRLDGSGSNITTTYDIGYSMLIGDAGGDGSLYITDGAVVNNTGWVEIGGATGSVGLLEIDGSGSRFNGTHAGFAFLLLGDGGFTGGDGTINVKNGGSFEFDDSVVAGYASTNTGTILVTGTNSSFDVAAGGGLGSNFVVGDAGTGTLTINSGGAVTAGNTLIIGDENTGDGTVTVDGSSSTLTVTGTTTVGNGTSTASLHVDNSGTATLNGAVAVNNGAIVELSSGGVINGTGAFTTFTGEIRGDGSISNAITLNGGTFNSNAASDVLTLSGVISGSSDLDKNGTGTLVLSGINTYDSVTNVNGGTLELSGSINSSSEIDVDSGAALAGTGTASSASLAGSGNIEPGANTTLAAGSDGILSVDRLNSTALDFFFEFTFAGAPVYSDVDDSLNDLIKITNVSAFAKSLASTNDVNLYLVSGSGTYQGGFYTSASASDFYSDIEFATYNIFVQDGSGSELYRGQSYSAYAGGYTVSTVSGGTGQVMQVVVPVPTAVHLGLVLLGLLYVRSRPKRRPEA